MLQASDQVLDFTCPQLCAGIRKGCLIFQRLLGSSQPLSRAWRVSFEQINPRNEQVALTLGCTRAQAFWRVVLPEARRGLLAAGTLAWARSLGEFGPILIFSGATRMKTEVLSTTVFLELSVGNIESAVAVSLLMIGLALLVLVLVRVLATDIVFGKALRP